MSRLYVDRISPYQSGSLVIDGYDPSVDTGSFATTGSNTFIGNEVISGSLAVSGSGNSNTWVTDWPADFGSKQIWNFGTHTSAEGVNFNSNTLEMYNYRQAANWADGLVFQFAPAAGLGQPYYSALWLGPNTLKYDLKPSGSANESSIKLQHDGDTSTTATVLADNITIGGNFTQKIDVTGSFKQVGSGDSFTVETDYPGDFQGQKLFDFGSHTSAEGVSFNSATLEVINYRNAANWADGLVFQFAPAAGLGQPYYSAQWLGPNTFKYDLKPSGSANESTLNIIHDGDGTTTANYQANDISIGTTFNDSITIGRSGNTNVISGSVDIETVLQLNAQDPLPGGGLGQLAVSGSNLYFHNGTSWNQIS